MIIPQLEEVFKQVNSLPILFIGAGFSRRYLNAPRWIELLSYFANICTDNTFGFKTYEAKALKKIGEAGLSHEINQLYPLIATMIEEDFNIHWYESADYSESRNKYADQVNKGVSPFKIEISQHLKLFSKISEEHNIEINAIKKALEKSVASVITTNYDTLIEDLSSYSVYVGQSELLFQQYYGIGDLFKIHGSLNTPESIMINKKDYGEFNDKQKYLAAKLLTLFIENPIIFIGYSINDQNILNILESISDCLNESQVKLLSKRMFFVEYEHNKPDISISKRTIRFSRNSIEMTEITLSSFLPIFESLQVIKSKHPVRLLRIIDKHFHTIIHNRNAEGKLLVMNPDELLANIDEDAEVIVGFGVRDLGKHGYGAIKAEQIYKDVIFDDQSFDINYLVELTLPELLPHVSNSLPVFKYLSQYEREYPEKIKLKFSDFSFESLRTVQIKALMSSMRNKSINYILNSNMSTQSKMSNIAALPQETLSAQIDDLGKFIKSQFVDDPNILACNAQKTNATALRKLIRMYDYLMYKK